MFKPNYGYLCIFPSEISSFENDQTTGYTFNQSAAGSGSTEFKTMPFGKNKYDIIVMNVSADANAVHEITHAYQVGIQKEYSLPLNSGSASFPGLSTFASQVLNAGVEVEAYEAQYAFDLGSMPASIFTGTPQSSSQISPLYVAGINNQNPTVPVYKDVLKMVV